MAEGLEEGGDLVLGDADAGVFDGDFEEPLGRGDGLAADVDGDVALVGEFDSVADEVDEDLLEAGFVGSDDVGEVILEEAIELEVFLFGEAGIEAEGALDAGAEVEGGGVEFEFARLHFREVEDVVEQREEHFAAGGDGVDELALFLGEVGFGEEGGEAHDGVHGGAEVMAYHIEEFFFGAVFPAGLVEGVIELALELFEAVFGDGHGCDIAEGDEESAWVSGNGQDVGFLLHVGEAADVVGGEGDGEEEAVDFLGEDVGAVVFASPLEAEAAALGDVEEIEKGLIENLVGGDTSGADEPGIPEEDAVIGAEDECAVGECIQGSVFEGGRGDGVRGHL